MKLDRALFGTDDELDIDPLNETDDVDELLEEFDEEQVQLTYYYLHRYQLFEMKVLVVDDLDWDDVLAFSIIQEEKSCLDAQEQTKLKSQAERLK